ncbi:hypothetical protein FH608_022335 [Nonomuraea phyllanthi]|uniref:Uncharacterized protein n=1 Tax=Nonomuraea phyllanthi TaxID=2219224 RepID=A0A5C4WBN9_9ACTN|nr:DMT family transporter [Nonomuraea phyllanthi]KAB8193071.1 hypothetical protein FH608_022335 [Nonomuraea phyllanthi]QFY11067.1 hypothetical protein GBF35_34725 [Nonomuraea phyllanthi]
MIGAGILAFFAAACNAASSVLQRRASLSASPDLEFRLGLFWALIRNPVWLWGIGALIGGFIFQAAALSIGGIALVQPALVIELPLTMIILSIAFNASLDRKAWIAICSLTGGLALFLAAAAPGPGRWTPATAEWIVATAATAGTVGALVAVAALTTATAARPALLGIAAGISFAFTATLIKKTTMIFQQDPGQLFVTWPLYGMVAAGLCAVFLLQNALHSGTLVVAQPALTMSDPMAGILYGALMFGEPIRTGSWVVLEVVGVGLMVYGLIELNRSPLIQAQSLIPPDSR